MTNPHFDPKTYLAGTPELRSLMKRLMANSLGEPSDPDLDREAVADILARAALITDPYEPGWMSAAVRRAQLHRKCPDLPDGPATTA